jgi:hypothetical protein
MITLFRGKPHPDQLDLTLTEAEQIEEMIEERAAIRAEENAIRWRFRLILIETQMIAILVLAAGLTVGQSAGIAIRGALIVGLSCFLSGMALIGLSGVSGLLLSRFHRRRQS